MKFNGKTMTAFGEFTINEGRTEKVVEPAEVEEGIYWDTSEQNPRARNDCDLYNYKFKGMFGKTAKVKAILPYGSSIIINDYGNEFFNEWYDSTAENDCEIEKEFPITSDDFELRVSCVRAEGYPQVIVISAGGGNAEPVSHTSCFDGTYEGEFVDNDITSLRYGAFAGCENITKVSLPNCTNIGGNYAFYDMTSVKEILLPNVTGGVFGATFNNCPNVQKIDLRSLGGVLFDSNCFRYCTKLQILILGGTEINRLANTNVLGGTPATMSIYVPDDLVEAYKAADYWKTDAIVNKIKPLSELEE